MKLPLLFGLLAMTATAGCAVTPENFETDPVTLATQDGDVTCQLYSSRLTTWDRSIDRPASMSVKTADEICQAEGRRVLVEG
ncbi:hypothetical protein JSE7799_00298 [Jannaschia seosinensis]|uniref:Uncharacterized protein n=1 Tax=Jannaschia seosinensis TaxID=313367 RepID=A0A0M7B6I5_9RHOB|nr:hypothetical protein [Jannaschia seosinensis]CUH15157.1 hypothetical protein JSE7799_00298 [Jannaschia seosinensis]